MDEPIKHQMENESPSIQVSDDGPLLVRGPVDLIDMEGLSWSRDTKNLVLCRCGRSENKPFCDGSHAQVGFSSRPRAEGTVSIPEVERRAG